MADDEVKKELDAVARHSSKVADLAQKTSEEAKAVVDHARNATEAAEEQAGDKREAEPVAEEAGSVGTNTSSENDLPEFASSARLPGDDPITRPDY